MFALSVRISRTSRQGRLEQIESRINDCLTLANSINPEAWQIVTNHLRKARREIVWMMAE